MCVQNLLLVIYKCNSCLFICYFYPPQSVVINCLSLVLGIKNLLLNETFTLKRKTVKAVQGSRNLPFQESLESKVIVLSRKNIFRISNDQCPCFTPISFLFVNLKSGISK